MSLDNDGVINYLNSLDKESLAIKEEMLRICWYMRGGINYDEVYLIDFQDREIIGKIIKDNLETTKKSGLPFF